VANESSTSAPGLIVFVAENALALATVFAIFSMVIGIAGFAMMLHRNGAFAPSVRRRTHIDQRVDEYTHA
jgi:hypothetical protein